MVTKFNQIFMKSIEQPIVEQPIFLVCVGYSGPKCVLNMNLMTS